MAHAVVVFLALCISSVMGARILGVFPIPSKSHQNVHDAIILELANRGHEITMITPFPWEHPPPNLKQIDVSFVKEKVKSFLSFNDFANKGPIDFYETFETNYPPIFEELLNMSEVQDILNGDEDQFDVVFMSFVTTTYGFAHKFKNAASIVVATLPVHLSKFGGASHPVLYDEFYTIADHETLTFYQKLQSIYNHLRITYFDEFISHTYQNNLLKYFGNDTPPFVSLTKEMDLLFVYSSPLIFKPRPMPPSIVNIEGIHLKPKKPLAKDIQEFLDKSTQGVVYMSLGSNVQSQSLGNKTLEMMIAAFGELPYNVLWKFEADNLPGLPENVFIKKWMPQQDLLGHRNIKAFVFQGGQQSLEEAVRDGVPLICIPFASDQKANAERIVKKGLGLKLDISTLTKEKFKDTIMNVTKETRYKENMLKLAKLFNDQPETPMERAIWWIEYVIRHKGAKHLRSPALNVSYAEFFLLDVEGFVLLFAVVTIALFLVVVRKLSKILQASSTPTKIKLKKK